jgi:steroid delta-isomerase-like uncharacterized protein
VVSEELRRKREGIVVEHMESENRHEFDVTLETFDHPRYELIGTGDVYDGPEEVAAYFEETRSAFPDQRNELIAMHHSDDAVIVEAMLYGTHDGSFRGLPPTGRRFEMRFCALFLFDEERLICERVYFEPGTILRQLGIAHDPMTLRGRVGRWSTTPSRSATRWCARSGDASRYFNSRERRRSFSTRPSVCSEGQ